MARVTYAPVTGNTVGQTVGASKPQPVTPKVATMKPETSNPVGSMPYQPPGPATQPPSGGISHPPPVPPTRVPVNGGASGVSNSFNPSAPPPVKPPPQPVGGGQVTPSSPPGRNEPPVRQDDGSPGGLTSGSGVVLPNVPPIPLPNLGGNFGGQVSSIGLPNEPRTGLASNSIGGGTPPPSPVTSSIPEPILPNATNPFAVVGSTLSGTARGGTYDGIPEPILPNGYNPGGGNGGGIVQNPPPTPFPETDPSTWNNAARAELAPPVGSYTRFADRGKWEGQDAQAQRIANRRAKKNKGNANDATPETGNLVAPPAPKKKKAKKPAQVTQPESSNAGGTPEGNKNKKNKKDKKDKNAKVTKADKQKAKNRTPQPGTPARPYRSHGVNYKPLGYGGTLRI